MLVAAAFRSLLGFALPVARGSLALRRIWSEIHPASAFADDLAEHATA